MRKTVKSVLHRSGFLKLFGSRDPSRITVLLYHGFREAGGETPKGDVSAKFTPVDLFEQQVGVCLEYGSVVSLEDAVSGSRVPSNPVVLTFDDGYENNYSLAFPVLRKYGVPATIFLTTGFLDGAVPLWMDRFAHIVSSAPAGRWEKSLGGGTVVLDFTSGEARMDSLGKAKERMKREPIDEILRFVDTLQEEWGIRYDGTVVPESLRPLRWDQVREMVESGLISFGAHTVSHPVLSRCPPAVQEREIAESKRRVEEETGRRCTSFAYPNGKEGDFGETAIDIVRRCGFGAAVTTVHGFVWPHPGDPFRLPRWGIPSSAAELAYLLTR